MTPRTAERVRTTTETEVSVTLDLDPVEPISTIDTGLGFLDHMLTLVAFHGRLALTVTARGDLEVDDHHTVEDVALVLGAALDDALGDRAGAARYGTAYVPMDEALARVVIDCSGRPASVIELGLTRERLGAVACENLPHFFASLATTLRAAIHVDVLRGTNDHHRAEAAFKALGRALRCAVQRDGSAVPSTKGAL